MRNPRSLIFTTLACLLGTSFAAAGDVSFNAQVRPILSRHCIACHGPDEADLQADLRLDIPAGATEDRGGYAAIVPGEPDKSELIARILSDDDSLRMPPADHAAPLKPQEIDILKRWIEQGAKFEAHWAFTPPQLPDLPAHLLEEEDLPQSDSGVIDHFIDARLAEVELQRNSPAQPHALVRRLSLDLTGLPPLAHGDEVTAAVRQYLDEPSDAHYGQLADALMRTPAFAEHWASVWLDLARYADTVGYAGDENRDIWPWRDWLIHAILQGKTYKEMSIEMLAGDLLPDATDEQRLATAFHRNTLNNNEGGTNDEEFRTIAIKDRLSTTLNVWMGLTVRCAECHSHKYDPISQTEYYQLLDFFNQSADADTKDDSPKLAVTPLRDPNDTAEESDAKPAATKGKPKDKPVAKPVSVPVMAALPADKRRDTFVHLRGNFQSHGEKVTAAFPAAFASQTAEFEHDRLGLARWLFADDNPLTARVAVNRYWARMMGQGLVETEEDFGTQGLPPSHPELLDYLAVRFQDGGWDVRTLLKSIVMSGTYRQSQLATEKALTVDPYNKRLSRGPRVRLTAEAVRDQALAVSGLLSDRMYGPPVFPPNPVKRVVNAFTGGMTWKESDGEDRYRRAIYTFLKRSSPHPLFETFDMASRDVCNLRRLRTNTPLQSFMTLNDITFIEAARALAEQMLAESNGRPAEGIAVGLQRALFVESADGRQVDVLVRLFDRCVEKYEQNLPAAAELTGVEADVSGLSEPEREALVRHAAMTVVANVILNLDGFLNN